MRKLTVSLAVIGLVGSVASAHAQCSFDGPAKAKGIKTSLVRSFAGCPSITFAAPNSGTGTGVPSCAPPYAHSDFQFDNKAGSCNFSTSAKVEDPCKDNSGVPCMNLKIKTGCKGVVDALNVPTSASGWSVSTVSRATLNDPDNGDMTVIDFPVQIPFPAASKGKLSAKTDTNTLLNGLGLAALPACAQVEIVSLSIQDPSGNPFAKLGAGTRFPKGQ